jgi:hypothetical protein
MSDVFISYAREDRSLAEALAHDLQQKGFGVWWDAELVGSDNYQDVILAALARAKAAIVIWTKNSVTSNFVRDEARYALFHNKLIATKAGALDVIDIPFGFQSQHTEDVLNRDNILRAIEKLGVRPEASISKAGDDWEHVRKTQDTAKLLAWIGENPTHPSHTDAVALVQQLLESPRAVEAIPTVTEPVVRRSRLVAFFRGLTFQLPRFQLVEEGTWSSIGLTITLLAVFLSAFYVWISSAYQSQIYLYGQFLDNDMAIAALTLHTFLAAFLSYYAFNMWVRQRNLKAALITSPVFILSFSGSFGLAAVYLIRATIGVSRNIAFPLLGIGAIISFFYLAFKVKRAR